MKSLRILDSRGNPVPKAATGMYEASSPYKLKTRTLFINNYVADYSDNVSTGDWKTILSKARDLYSNTPSIKNSIHEIADLAIGDAWAPKFTGEDRVFEEEAKQFLDQWFQMPDFINSSGFQSILKQTVVDVLRDGDNLIVLTSTSDGSYPKIQVIPAHRIGSRGIEGEINEGQYKGYLNNNGIIHDQFGLVVAYQILGKDKESDRYISARDAALSFERDYSDQLRGLSPLASALNIWDELRTIQSFELQGIKHASNFAVQMYVPPEEIDETAGQAAEFTDEVTVTGNDDREKKMYVETLQGGEVHVWHPASGAKLDVLDTKGGRPGPATSEFLQNFCIRQACLSLRWPIELTYDMNSRGATTKLVISKAQRRIEDIQSRIIYPLWKRIVNYVIRKGIKNGYISESKDWYKWEPTYPRTLVFDSARETAADIELYKLGVITGNQLAGALGYDYEENLKAKADELEYAKELSASKGINSGQLIQITPNGNAISDPVSTASTTQDETNSNPTNV